MRATQEQELESLQEQLEGVNRNIEEVEANMKTLGISLVQVSGRGKGHGLGQARSRALRGPVGGLLSLADVRMVYGGYWEPPGLLRWWEQKGMWVWALPGPFGVRGTYGHQSGLVGGVEGL